jgi:hypothetical protein
MVTSLRIWRRFRELWEACGYMGDLSQMRLGSENADQDSMQHRWNWGWEDRAVHAGFSLSEKWGGPQMDWMWGLECQAKDCPSVSGPREPFEGLKDSLPRPPLQFIAQFQLFWFFGGAGVCISCLYYLICSTSPSVSTVTEGLPLFLPVFSFLKHFKAFHVSTSLLEIQKFSYKSTVPLLYLTGLLIIFLPFFF